MAQCTPSPKAEKMPHPTFRLSALAALVAATAAACPLVAQATVPAGAAAEIISLQGTGDQRAASAADWGPARLAQALAEFGRIEKTLYTLAYLDDEAQRRATLTQLNRWE